MSTKLPKNLEMRAFLDYNVIKTVLEVKMLDKILDIISKFAKIDASLINGDTNILELDVDSLTILKIVMDVEQTFSIRFDDEEIVDVRTARDIENIVINKIS